jgi:aminoglycoside phosphotransferase family enzyme/predicted kinase
MAGVVLDVGGSGRGALGPEWAASPPAVAETHSAVVFFLGDLAYKLKKPLDLGFLDFRSVEARKRICHREVELNRRLAPDVYLGVADVTGPDGHMCDHLVVMRRMPADRRLASLVRAGVPVEGHLWDLAHMLAAFHGRSDRTQQADEAAGAHATRLRWDANTDALIQMGGGIFDDWTVARVHALACRYLDGRQDLFEHRVADGRAVDGHGDLLADDIFCLDDGPRVLDCIEFDDSLRLGDELADVAFLAMDLERLGRADLSRYILVAYGEHRGDVWPSSLAHHHIAYRAQVRAKVTAIRAGQGDRHAPAEAIRLLDLAAAHLEEGRVRLVLVGGLPGTGKSTLASGLSSELDATLLRSDEIRKEISGLPADSHRPAAFGSGIYSERATEATYDELLDRADVALRLGETVVLDASWSSPTWRDRARRIAARTMSDLVELRCEAPPLVAAERIRDRAIAGGDPSDATPEIASAMAAAATPWPEATTIVTTGPPAVSLASALRHVTRRGGPPGSSDAVLA